MQYFYNLELAAPVGSGFCYTPGLVAAYEEPTELTALAEMLAHPKWGKWMTRIRIVRQIPRT